MSLIETIIINKNITKHIYQGTHGIYYMLEVNGKKTLPYDIHFPVEWILNEKRFFEDNKAKITGHIFCNKCRVQGMWHSVIIGYCNVCAEHHKYQRGNGLFGYKTDKGLPYEVTHCINNSFNFSNFNIQPVSKDLNTSMFNTYLKNVDVKNNIGDDKLEEMYKNGNYNNNYEFMKNIINLI